jgi:hypothetical protein
MKAKKIYIGCDFIVMRTLISRHILLQRVSLFHSNDAKYKKATPAANCPSGRSDGSKKLVLTISFATVQVSAVLKSSEGKNGRLVELLKSTILVDYPLFNKLIFLHPQLLIIAVSAFAKKSSLGSELSGGSIVL